MFNGLDLHSSKNRVIWISPLLLQPPVQDGSSILENIYYLSVLGLQGWCVCTMQARVIIWDAGSAFHIFSVYRSVGEMERLSETQQLYMLKDHNLHLQGMIPL